MLHSKKFLLIAAIIACMTPCIATATLLPPNGASTVRFVLTGTSDVSADTVNTTIKWTSTSAASKTETLPACVAGIKNLTITIKDGAGSAGTYPITVSSPSSTIDGATNFSLNNNKTSFAFQCDGNGDWTVE